MAKKSTGKPPARGSGADPRKAAGRTARPARRKSSGERPVTDTPLAEGELATARARIAELEEARNELSRRIGAAIATIRKLLES